jgi:hypothetical protein
MSELVKDSAEGSYHEDWAALARSFVAGFPQIAPGEVVENIARNRRAAESFGVAEAEQLSTVEVMTRHQLMQLSGQTPDNARYKREQHLHRERRIGDADSSPADS